jgi:hypothetical protein
MTFKKKDPELVTLFFVAPGLPQGKARQYRVSKRQEFVTALQVRYHCWHIAMLDPNFPPLCCAEKHGALPVMGTKRKNKLVLLLPRTVG